MRNLTPVYWEHVGIGFIASLFIALIYLTVSAQITYIKKHAYWMGCYDVPGSGDCVTKASKYAGGEL